MNESPDLFGHVEKPKLGRLERFDARPWRFQQFRDPYCASEEVIRDAGMIAEPFGFRNGTHADDAMENYREALAEEMGGYPDIIQ